MTDKWKATGFISGAHIDGKFYKLRQERNENGETRWVYWKGIRKVVYHRS